MIFTNQLSERSTFKNARANLKKTVGLNPVAVQNAVLTQSYLRLIQPLTTTSNTFKFPVLINQQGTGNPVRPDEQRLKQQDAFYVSKIWIYLFKTTSATDMAVSPQTYPNPVTFTLGGATVSAGSAPLYAFYNGKVSVTVNNNIQVPGYPISKFMNIPQTQLTAATNSPLTQIDGSVIMPWEPNLVFVGTYDNEINITLPGNVTAIDTFTYMQIELEGVLAQNVALGSV